MGLEAETFTSYPPNPVNSYPSLVLVGNVRCCHFVIEMLTVQLMLCCEVCVCVCVGYVCW